MSRIYFDHNATAPLHPLSLAGMLEEIGRVGNPSSLHEEGRRARQSIERARDRVAQRVGGRARELVFTSGGTEANQLGIRGLALRARAKEAERTCLVLSPLEHPSVIGAAAALQPEGFTTRTARVDGDGRVDLDHLATLITSTTAVVAVQLANHELGTIQDLGAVTQLARAAGAAVHCDAVQALGKLEIDVHALASDTVALSAHKIGGPAGVGALWLQEGVELPPLWQGGHQERERRPGTENLLGIVGFGAAAAAFELASPALRERFEAGVLALGGRVHGGRAPRLPNTANVAFEGVEGELLMQALDLAGVAVSTGAACSSGSIEPSPVVRALGSGDPREAVRFSFGRDNREEEVDEVLALLPALLTRIREA